MATRVFAAEDGNLTSSIVTSRKKIYSDIDLTFSKRPSGDIYKKSDAAAVKQAVKNLLLTNNYEKPFNPTYGGNLQGLLFELVDDPVVLYDLRENIIEQIETFEPRAKVTNIEVNDQADNNAISVAVYFTVISTNEQVNVQTNISRLR
jgi:phage baseplate assembly protein W